LNVNQENVFPERALLDVDKEFEPAIALVMAFSMKENKLELERFRSMRVFPEFREIKDFGIRFYALDCGTDIQKAASVSIDIIKNVFDGEKAQTIQVTSYNATGKQICTKFIQPQKPKMQNEANSTRTQNKTNIISSDNQIVCPHCGSRLTVSKELKKTYYMQCSICGSEFANPLNPIGKSENWLNKNGSKWGCLIIVVIIAIAAIFAPKDDSTVAVGDNIVISTKTFGAIDEQAFDELNNAIFAKDQRGISELIFYDRIRALDVGTKGIVIKRNIGKARIRLIDGHAYWVNSDFIKPIN
jgi:DNA-directed RNA polymerase subunit RPC12/RpoP